jgi:hypothetical protein
VEIVVTQPTRALEGECPCRPNSCNLNPQTVSPEPRQIPNQCTIRVDLMPTDPTGNSKNFVYSKKGLQQSVRNVAMHWLTS